MGREGSWSRSFAFRRAEKESVVGCMSGILHLFDFHQIQHSPDPHLQQQPHSTRTHSLQDLEAPRNSLDLEFDAALPSLSKLDIEDDVDIQIGIQVRQQSTEKSSSAEISSLQGSKTPNLVARLMGLELLPDQASSPTIHRRTFSSYLRSVNETARCEMGSRSLPDTPRLSTARRSDVDPRLSLQLNKENIDLPEFRYLSRSFSRDSISTPSPYSTKKKMMAREGRIHEGNRSPRAREIVKQVKERVRRRVGTDITNIGCRNRSSSDDQSAKKTKRVSRTSEESKQNKQQSTPSSSPRLRHSENKEPMPNSPKGSSSKPCNPSLSPLSSTSTTLESLLLNEESEKPKPKPLPKSATMCRKANCERFTQRASGGSSSPRARKKCKTHLSNAFLVQIHPQKSNTAETRLESVITLPLPSASSHLQQHQEQPQKPNPPPPLEDRTQTTTTLCGAAAELPYVAALLDRVFTDRDSITRWHSPSHPLDPTLFLHLEGSFRTPPDGPLHQISIRRLLFDLVDEILRSLLKPHLVKKPWLEMMKKSMAFEREGLIEKVLLQVRRSPSAKCEMLQDVDGLVEIELREANVRRGGGGYSAVDEETEWVVFETERLILESLVEESLEQMTAVRLGNARSVW